MSGPVLLKLTSFLLIAALPLRANGQTFPPYVAVDLGTLGGDSFATAVNDLGQVVGYYYTTQGVQRAFLWLPRPAYGLERGMHDPGVLPSGWSEADDINNHGVVVGRSRSARPVDPGDLNQHLFVWDPKTHQITDLGRPPNSVGDFTVNQMNEAGQIVGDSYYDEGVLFRFMKGFLWLPQPAFGLPRGFSYSSCRASGINEFGQMIGWCESDLAGMERAYLWLPFPAYGLPAGGNLLPGLENLPATVNGINDFGDIVGDYAPGPGLVRKRAFLWSPEGLLPLDTPPSVSSIAFRINNAAQSIGSAGGFYTWIETAGASVRSLLPATPPGDVVSNRDINSIGQIVGAARINGLVHAVLLSPVRPDVTRDGTVDPLDQGMLAACMLGPEVLAPLDCDNCDIDRDGDVDFLDFRAWELAFSTGG